MSAIFSRYVARDIAITLGAVTLALLLIVLGRLLVMLLSYVVSGKLSTEVLGMMLTLGVIKYIVGFLPFALMLAVMLVVGRMYRDSEMITFFSSGGGLSQLFAAISWVAVPVLILLLIAILNLSPWAARLSEVVETVARQNAGIENLVPGRFFELEDQQWVVYAENEDASGDGLLDVFIQRQVGDKISVELAQRAYNQETESGSEVFVLEKGRRYEGVPGTREFQLSEYAQHRVYPPLGDFFRKAQRAAYQPLTSLWGSENPKYTAEFYRRISVPISTVLLLFLAVPLCRTTRSGSRFSRVAIAALIYVLYANLILLFTSWIGDGQAYAVVWVLFLHALVAWGAYYLNSRQYST